MFACAAWSVPYVERLLKEKADPNIEDSNGITAMNVVLDEIANWEDATELERIDCRERRRFMDETGFLVPDRPNVEELEPFNKMGRLFEVKKILETAGAKPGQNVRRPGYDTDGVVAK